MRILILIFFFLFQNSVNAATKSKIINNLDSIKNLKFNFVTNIGKKIEKGECIISYPKKIFCKYEDRYNKIMVSNGKSLVINSDRSNQYYRYKLDKTPLNLILDKKFLIKKIKNANQIELNSWDNYSLKIVYEKTIIILHFERSTLNLIGWITNDVYQNKVETKISNIENNLIISEKIFKIQNYIN